MADALRTYQVTTVSGTAYMQLSDADAARYGDTAKLVDETELAVTDPLVTDPAAGDVEGKARDAANKSRTAQNK